MQEFKKFLNNDEMRTKKNVLNIEIKTKRI